jgi:NTP pyrophosphatase (non-canonical NTP hydrolase)
MDNKTLEQYQKEVAELVKKFNFNWSTYVQYIHLVEEVGELGEALTVKEGDREAGSGERAQADHGDIKEELGDVLFTLMELANKYNVSLTRVMEDTFKRYQNKLQKINLG